MSVQKTERCPNFRLFAMPDSLFVVTALHEYDGINLSTYYMFAEQYFVAVVASSTLANWNYRIENCVFQITSFFNKSPLRNATSHITPDYKAQTENGNLPLEIWSHL